MNPIAEGPETSSDARPDGNGISELKTVSPIAINQTETSADVQRYGNGLHPAWGYLPDLPRGRVDRDAQEVGAPSTAEDTAQDDKVDNHICSAYLDG